MKNYALRVAFVLVFAALAAVKVQAENPAAPPGPLQAASIR